jgi:hypothetical protein
MKGGERERREKRRETRGERVACENKKRSLEREGGG